MPEVYKIEMVDASIGFTPADMVLPDAVFATAFRPDAAPAGLAVCCRMGDPDLVHCVVWREDGKPGGIFAFHDKNGLLFVAVARSALEYATALGHFGSLAANARYGVDVFENLEEPDD